MTERFGSLLEQAAISGLPEWNGSYNGLAAVLLMDQFSRQDKSLSKMGYLATYHASACCAFAVHAHVFVLIVYNACPRPCQPCALHLELHCS